MLSFISVVALLPLVSAHGFVKFAASDLEGSQRAQKTDLKSSAFRSSPDNTGWIGANFLTNEAIACGSSGTPFQTVAAPNGRQFAETNQAAGKHMKVKAGGTVTLTVAGNPGQGWPHPFGHVQVYMADCDGDCIGADATKLSFFKTQSEINGIQNTLRKNFDASQDGHKYTVNIPKGLKDGKYMMRFELIAFGQSGANEGRQDQYYPFCGQLDVQGGTGALNNLATVSFPGAYKNGNIDQKNAPGPAVLATTGGGQAPSGGSSDNNNVDDEDNEVSTGNPNNGGSNTVTTPDNDDNNSSDADNDEEGDCTNTEGPIALAASAPACASMCLSIKFSEAGKLASKCSLDGGAGCFCSSGNFMGAYAQCVRDNCGNDSETAIKALASQCGASSKKSSHKLMKKMLKKQNVKISRRVANHSRRAHRDNHRVKRSAKLNTIFEEVVGVARLTKH